MSAFVVYIIDRLTRPPRLPRLDAHATRIRTETLDAVAESIEADIRLAIVMKYAESHIAGKRECLTTVQAMRERVSRGEGLHSVSGFTDDIWVGHVPLPEGETRMTELSGSVPSEQRSQANS